MSIVRLEFNIEISLYENNSKTIYTYPTGNNELDGDIEGMLEWIYDDGDKEGKERVKYKFLEEFEVIDFIVDKERGKLSIYATPHHTITNDELISELRRCQFGRSNRYIELSDHTGEVCPQLESVYILEEKQVDLNKLNIKIHTS